MSLRRILILVGVMVCCYEAPLLSQSPGSSSEAELRALMAERRQASLEGDSDRIASSMVDDYLQTDVSGYVQDKTTWLNEYFNPLAS